MSEFANTGLNTIFGGMGGLGAQNIYQPPTKPRDHVTMNKPLEPWGHTRFHKFLAIHMHNATRLAGDNDGLVDDVETAQKWDLATVVQ